MVFTLIIEVMGGYVVMNAVIIQNQREHKPSINGRSMITLCIISLIILATISIRVYLF
ncbi:hypothetical protein [Marinilactibacillus kalidii]|uniref:hypothetical protein n=1 Tax=Marinilactibacillus kalidii TaxID=2820274 RepID=UPI001ABDCD38|nr:hypothetical protein [Marinilactibacillus kalidii]